jgi:hypothetical protein
VIVTVLPLEAVVATNAAPPAGNVSVLPPSIRVQPLQELVAALKVIAQVGTPVAVSVAGVSNVSASSSVCPAARLTVVLVPLTHGSVTVVGLK